MEFSERAFKAEDIKPVPLTKTPGFGDMNLNSYKANSHDEGDFQRTNN